MPQAIAGKRVGLVADLPGWRNPGALALGVAEMGGTCVTLAASLQGTETPEDLGGYMANWVDALAVRTPSLARLRRLGAAFGGPVVNLRTDDNHPCEVLGDLSFVRARRGGWEGLRVAVVGPAGNIAASWAEAAGVLPITVTQVTPRGFALDDPRVAVAHDLGALEGAEVIVTDCWPKALEAEGRAAFGALQVTEAALARAGRDVLFIPCPPVTRGEEVSAGAMAHPACVAVAAKAWLMHAQNAWLEAALGARP